MKAEQELNPYAAPAEIDLLDPVWQKAAAQAMAENVNRMVLESLAVPTSTLLLVAAVGYISTSPLVMTIALHMLVGVFSLAGCQWMHYGSKKNYLKAFARGQLKLRHKKTK